MKGSVPEKVAQLDAAMFGRGELREVLNMFRSRSLSLTRLS